MDSSDQNVLSNQIAGMSVGTFRSTTTLFTHTTHTHTLTTYTTTSTHTHTTTTYTTTTKQLLTHPYIHLNLADDIHNVPYHVIGRIEL